MKYFVVISMHPCLHTSIPLKNFGEIVYEQSNILSKVTHLNNRINLLFLGIYNNIFFLCKIFYRAVRSGNCKFNFFFFNNGFNICFSNNNFYFFVWKILLFFNLSFGNITKLYKLFFFEKQQKSQEYG